MVFQPLIADGQEYELSYFTNGNDHVVTLPFGEDEDPPRVYSILVTLSSRSWIAPETFEFTFAVVEHDVETDADYTFWSGLDTRGKIRLPEHRAQCLDFVCAALNCILTRDVPENVFMQTYDADLPPAAKTNYARVLESFSNAGYTIETQPVYHGRDSWFMKRGPGLTH